MKIIEIRAGEGGADASLFSTELEAAVSKWASAHGAKVEPLGAGVVAISGPAHCL